MKNTLLLMLALAVTQLLQSQSAYLWGTAATGGALGYGTIIRGNDDGTDFETVYSFDSTNGSYPSGGLIMAGNGKIYGTTQDGGYDDSCTIFCFDPVTNTLTKIYDFYLNLPQGGEPTGGMTIAPNGIFYGLTTLGGANSSGVVFSLDPSNNTYTDLYDFDANTSPIPQTEFLLANDGKLYGLATYLTPSYSYSTGGGAIFSFDPGANTFQPLYYIDTANPYDYYGNFLYNGGNLIQAANGKLYGVGASQQANGITGNIFSYDINSNTYTNLYNITDGPIPMTGLVQAGNGKLYGTTAPDSTLTNLGYIYSYDITADTFSIVMNFNNSTGYDPMASLGKLGSGAITGSTFLGGQYGYGTLFTLNVNTSTYTKILDLDSTGTGANPQCEILEAQMPNAAGIAAVMPSDEMSLYPNPSTGNLYIQNAAADAHYSITNMQGQEISQGIFTGRFQTIDVSQLAAGMYMINKLPFVKE